MATETIEIRDIRIPTYIVIEAARQVCDERYEMPEMCSGCEAKIHDPGDWDIPEAWGCPCDFAPYDECCRRHERIFDDDEVLGRAYEIWELDTPDDEKERYI